MPFTFVVRNFCVYRRGKIIMQRISFPWNESLTLLAGVLVTLSFSPFDYWLLAIVAMSLLLASCTTGRVGQAVRCGYCFGLGQFGAGVSWLCSGIHDYGGTDYGTAATLTVFLVAYLALFPALACWVSFAFFRHCIVLRLLGVFPAVWGLTEWVRSWLLSGFPWLQLGYSQLDSPLAGLAPVTGVYGLSWMCALTASSLVAVFYLRGFYYRAGLIGLLLICWCGSGMMTSVAWTQPLAEPFQAALIQANISSKLKWKPRQRDDALRIYSAMTRQVWGSRLVVWPETALPMLYDSLDPRFINSFREELINHDSDLLFGIITAGSRHRRYFNTMKLWGKHTGDYHKRHLVPFAEYDPVSQLPKFIAGAVNFPMADFSSGPGRQQPLLAAGFRVAASICYEAAFGSEMLLGLPEAAYLVNISNDDWAGSSLAPYQHFQMARFRALETGRYLLRAAVSGITAFIGPKGEIIRSAPLFARTVLVGRVVPMTGSTPYVRWGDNLALTVFGFSWGMAVCWGQIRTADKRSPLPQRK